MDEDASAAAAPAATHTSAAEGPCLNWWQQRQLPVLASAENSGVVLLLGGAEGSAALRCSVLLPLLLLQHGWAPQTTHCPSQQQHILVALETSSSVDSAAALAKAWGGGCYASCITTHRSILRGNSSLNKEGSSPPRIVYLTAKQLLQRLLQQPLLPGCCAAAVEVSLLHSFSTELLLPLLQKVHQKRPALRLLLLLPPAGVQPYWALQLAEFFAAGDDPAAPGAAVMPQGSLEVLRAAAQQQELLLRFLTPRGGRWDVKHRHHKQKMQQEVKDMRLSLGANSGAAATAKPSLPHAINSIELLEITSSSTSRSSRSSSGVSCISSDEVMVLGVTVAQGQGPQGRLCKRKKPKRKDKKKLQQRLSKIQRKLDKICSSTKSGSTRNLLAEGAICMQTDTLAAARGQAQFVDEASHAVQPEGSSGEEASPVRRAESSPHMTEGDDEATEKPSCPQPLRFCRHTNHSKSSVPAMPPMAHGSPEASPVTKGSLSTVTVLSLTPPTQPVAIRYLKSPTPNYIRTAAAVGGSPQQLLLPPVVECRAAPVSVLSFPLIRGPC